MTDSKTTATEATAEKRAAELEVAHKELLQNEDKAKRTAEMVTAIKELLSQNEEKAKRAAELVNSIKEILLQNEEKAKQAAELVSANKDLISVLERLKACEAERRALDSNLESKSDAPVAEVPTPSGLLPICSWCKKIRDESGSWHEIEEYISKRTGEQITHGMCPECREKMKSD